MNKKLYLLSLIVPLKIQLLLLLEDGDFFGCFFFLYHVMVSNHLHGERDYDDCQPTNHPRDVEATSLSTGFLVIDNEIPAEKIIPTATFLLPFVVEITVNF